MDGCSGVLKTAVDEGLGKMIENNPSNVSSAFEMLLEEVEAEIDFVNGVGAKAFESRDYDKAKEALERSGTLTGIPRPRRRPA